MDTKGNIEEHSKEKLSIYEKYLECYLFVLTNTNYYINIFEPFAGQGMSENSVEKGSALKAAEVIQKFRDKGNKKITLYLNDSNIDNYRKLEKNLTQYKEFFHISNLKGKVFLGEILKILDKRYNMHNFFFLDPFGYTQYSKDNLLKLLSLERCDSLIFLPTSFIYRFLQGYDTSPAVNFINDLGINLSPEKNETLEGLVRSIILRFRETGHTKFVYSYEIKNRKASSIFHLFFITKHKKGAEKFLEAKERVEKEFKNGEQLTLIDVKREEQEEERNNQEIYEQGLLLGCRSRTTTSILKELEGERKLVIRWEGSRRKDTYYLTNKDKKLFISWRKNE